MHFEIYESFKVVSKYKKSYCQQKGLYVSNCFEYVHVLNSVQNKSFTQYETFSIFKLFHTLCYL